MRAMRAAVIALVIVTGACSSERGQPTSASTPTTTALPAVSLPDLSRMDPEVQQQMNEGYRSLQALSEKHGAPGQLARAYGDMGNLLMAAEYVDAAEPFYLHAQALAPDEVRWPYYLGHVYMARADPTRAIASFERALQLHPDDIAMLVWLGNVHLDHGEFDRAEARFSRALQVQPRTVAALFGLGRTALARHDYARAADLLEQVLATDPRASIAHYPLALAYRGLGDTARAETHLSQRGGLEIGPPDPLMVDLRDVLRGAVAEENRGIRALDAGDFRAAADHFRKGVELAPANASLRHKLGTALSLSGDARGAIEQFEETLRRSPRFAQAHYSLGVILASNGRSAEAIQHLSEAVKDEPNYIEARLRLGEMLGRTGQFEPSLAQYRQVLAIDPSVAEARFGYAGALVGLRRYKEARESLAESARLYPNERRFTEALQKLPY